MHAYDKSLQSAFQLFQKQRKPSCDLGNVGVKSKKSATRIYGVTCEELQRLDEQIIPALPQAAYEHKVPVADLQEEPSLDEIYDAENDGENTAISTI